MQPADLPLAIAERKAGRVEFRNDRTGNLHVPVGKASLDYEPLLENTRPSFGAEGGLHAAHRAYLHHGARHQGWQRRLIPA
ncbi:MAG: hypothetical protein OXF32_00895 [Anaerolineaceae bacterium]|nr:hypothetical protein [Anaerolineaceae bacterium]